MTLPQASKRDLSNRLERVPHYAVDLAVHFDFIACLERLSKEDRKRVVVFIDKLRKEELTSGLRQHEVMNGFLSYSPSMAIRVIGCNQSGKLVLLHVARHDDAYAWASTHSAATQQGTNSLEIVHRPIDRYETPPSPVDPARLSMRESIAVRLRRFSIPEEIACSFEQCFEDDDALELMDSLSPEWQETILEAMMGGNPQIPVRSSAVVPIYPDDDLETALTLPIHAWRAFLHPNQRDAVNDSTNQLICLQGGPGSGKSVVCVHRAAELGTTVQSDETVLLLTYSLNLVTDLRQTLRQVIGPSTRIDSVLVASTQDFEKPSDLVQYYFRRDGELVASRSGSELIIRHIVVDEAQDDHEEFVEMLNRVIEEGRVKSVCVAFDLDQAILRRARRDFFDRLASEGKIYRLTYCYRMSRQILSASMSFLAEALAETGSATTLPASRIRGPAVRVIAVDNEEDQVRAVRRAVAVLAPKYDPQSLACIFVQQFNTHFQKSGRIDPLEALLKSDDLIGKFYRYAPLCKGKEFFATVLVVPASFMKVERTGDGHFMRFRTLYVALSRAREELVIVYDTRSPVAPFISAIE